jgi:hypothetical protein
MTPPDSFCHPRGVFDSHSKEKENEMYMTNHAQARTQQRAIPPLAVEALISYGRLRRHRGADVYFLDRESRGRLARALGKVTYLNIEKALDTYLVVGDDGCLITAAHRHQRLKF